MKKGNLARIREEKMKIELKGISKKYGKTSVLSNVNQNFIEGVYGILGPNGAGKTTLLNIIASVLSPNEGKIYYEDKEINELGENYRAILGYLPQKMDFYNHFTGYDFLKYMYLLKGGKQKNPKQLDDLLQRVHLYDVRNNKIGTYSGGMKQRLGIAQAFIGEPKLLLLDEPTVGLDLEERAEFKKMVKEYGKIGTVILSTHIVSDIEETADYILFISEGKILESRDNDYYKSYMEEHDIEGLEQYYLQLSGRRLDDSAIDV